MITSALVSLLVSVALANIIYFIWKRRHWYYASRRFNGPLALPIIGNGYLFMCKNEEILMRIYGITKKNTAEPLRFWLGPILLISLANPEHVEKILSSSKFVNKHDIYRFPQVFLGQGLITGSGPHIKPHRRFIQPMFSLDFAKETTSFMQKHVELCMKRLEPYLGTGNFDFFHVVHPCMADIIKEIILGSDERSQVTGTTSFDQAMLDGYDLAFTRMAKPWKQPDILFNMTSLKTRQDEIKKTIRATAQVMIDNAFKRRRLIDSLPEFHPIIDRIVDHIEENPGALSPEHFIDNVLSLYTASQDTMSIISSLLAMCLGMYPEYQEKAAKEIRDVFGETPRPVTTMDIPKLEYIEMCIKETLRLFPIAPVILRKCSADFQIDKWIIPKGSAIVIPIFTLQRDAKVWKKPDDFYPDHFLPEEESKRHVYSYIPFSAGPRGCIGKRLAYTGIKIFISNLLQRYEVECDGDVPSLKIKMDISTRPTNGCCLRLKKRIWK